MEDRTPPRRRSMMTPTRQSHIDSTDHQPGPSHGDDSSAPARIPLLHHEWYLVPMSGTHQAVMGDRGRLVVPVELRDRLGLRAGDPVVLVETPLGVVLATRAQLRQLVRTDLQGVDLVGELLADRRSQAEAEDVV